MSACGLCWSLDGTHAFGASGRHSKWMEVKPVKSATSASTISHLWSIFATHGLPQQTKVLSSKVQIMKTEQNPTHHICTYPPCNQRIGRDRGQFRHSNSSSRRPRFMPLDDALSVPLHVQDHILPLGPPYRTTFYHWDLTC